MKKCLNCGTETDTLFCPNCGTKMSANTVYDGIDSGDNSVNNRIKSIFEETENNDFSAIFLVAKLCRDDIIHIEEDEYILWFKRFFENETVSNFIDSIQGEMNDNYNYPGIEEGYLLRQMIMEAGIELGLYYRRSSSIDELEYAKKVLGCAWDAIANDHIEIEDGDDRIDIVSLMGEINEREERLLGDNGKCFDEVPLNLEERIVKCFGEVAWSRLQSNTQIDIITSERCYQSFVDDEVGFDYSCVINPIMKGLEMELKILFYDGYMEYLKKSVPIDSYLQSVIDKPFPDCEERVRRMILYFDKKGNAHYQKKTDLFTIGNLIYTICDKKDGRYYFDTPFIDYLLHYYSKMNVSEKEIKKWLEELLKEIPSLRKFRNDSAHAGIIQNKIDAETVLNDLFKVKRILRDIVCPPFERL